MPESSFTQKYGPSFTNRPGGAGKQVSSIPELGWTDYERETPQIEQEIPLPTPPADFGEYMAPDYSDRNRFEEHVIMELGKNPFELNPMEALSVADENLPDLFHFFFGGRVVWNDRNKLTKEQADAWDEVVKSYHAWVFQQAEMEKAVLTDQYNFMMNQFDNAAKQYEANVARVRAQQEKVVAEKKKTAEVKAKAAQPPEVKSADVGAYQKQFEKIQTEFSDTGDVSTPSLEVFNKFARQKQLPELEVAGKKKQKRSAGPEWLPDWVRDILKKDILGNMNLQVKQPEKGKQGSGEKRIVEKRQLPDGRIIALFDDGTKGFVE